MPGFKDSDSNNQDLMFANNADFSGAAIPLEANGLQTNGQLWIGTTALNAGGTHINVGTITGSGGVIVTNGPGTINIAGTGPSTDLHTALYIVSSAGVGTGTGANYSTITSAIAAALGTGLKSTIFIMPGSTGVYTENFTLPANINLTAFGSDGYRDLAAATGPVTIVGKITVTDAGTRCISNIRLQTNSDFFLSVTGTAASIVHLQNCYINCSNNTGIQSTSTLSAIRLVNCGGDIATTGIAYLALSGGGGIEIDGGVYNNSGSSTTANTWSAGNLTIRNCEFDSLLTSSGTGAGNIYNVFFNTILGTIITHNGTGSPISVSFCQIGGGTSSSVSVGAGATINIYGSTLNSSNTNVVTGSGTLTASCLTFINTSSVINPTTVTPKYTNLIQYKATSQPCVFAFNASGTPNNTGDGTAYTLIFATERFDQNSNFDGTSTFTAPVTGKYLFCCNCLCQNMAAASTMSLALTVAGTSAKTYTFGNTSHVNTVAGNEPIGLSVIVDMTATDTATVVINVGGGAKTVGIFGGAADPRTSFSGHLVA